MASLMPRVEHATPFTASSATTMKLVHLPLVLRLTCGYNLLLLFFWSGEGVFLLGGGPLGLCPICNSKSRPGCTCFQRAEHCAN